MKKITLSVNSSIDDKSAKEISSCINNLSGVVAADVVTADAKAYAYAGDMLEAYHVSSKVREAGYNSHVVKEEYITDVSEYKESMFPHAAPVKSILQ